MYYDMDKKKKKRGGMKHGGKHERVQASMGRKMYKKGGGNDRITYGGGGEVLQPN